MEPIDAVVAWVDGNDPAHLRKLREYTGDGAKPRAGGADPTRFGDCGEIEYCVAGLLRHAPWLRRVHIVTDQQVPRFLQEAGGRLRDRVVVTDHREVFVDYEHCLPTFSSRAIEAMLWRIPGLSENFIYLNDDFSLLRPVAPTDFFREDKVVLRGHWREQRARQQGLRRLIPRERARAGNHEAQARSAAFAGSTRRYLQAPHVPHPMRRSTLAEFFAAKPQVLEETLGHRFRSQAQILTTALAAHLELVAGHAIVDNRLHHLRLKPASQWRPLLQRELRAADRDESLAFGCVQSLDQADERTRALVLEWLRSRVGTIDQAVA